MKVEKIKEIIADVLGTDVERLKTTTKKCNNGVEESGLYLDPSDPMSNRKCDIIPRFSIEELLKDGVTEQEVTAFALGIKSLIEKYGCLETSSIFNKEDILANCFYTLINTDMNREFLKKVPNKEFLDMSLIVRRSIPSGGFSSTSTVTNDVMQKAGITEEELMRHAYDNTKNQDYQIHPIEKFAGEDEGSPHLLHVIINHYPPIFGATAIAIPEILERLLSQFACDVYLIPSSIHELIVCPKVEGLSKWDLKTIVLTVNRDSNVLSLDEKLSDSLYLYDWKMKKVHIV